MRLFVAIDLPRDVKEALAALCAGVPGARWVPAENMHVTLRFIGEVDGARRDDIIEALSEVRADGFDLEMQGIGHFETRRQPHALWVRVNRSEPLLRLRESVENAVQRAGLPPEGRKFMPHVTLARLKEAPPGRVESFMQEHNLFRSRAVPVSDFTLFSSFLSRNGALYRPEAEFPFVAAKERDGAAEEEEEIYDPWGVSGS